jgi:hypothetical protein
MQDKEAHVQQDSAGPISGVATSKVGGNCYKKESSYLNYECIKSELKDDYDRRIQMVTKKLWKKAESDPSFMLLNNISSKD